MERTQIIEEVTKQVLAALATGGADLGLDCAQEAVANGAARLGYSGSACDVPAGLAQYIDHTVLKADVPPERIDTLCDEAMQYRFAAVCINPVWVRRAARRLRGSGVKVASVCGFPLGANVPEIKAMEARRAIRDGAREIDMVINVGALKAGDHELVRRDIAGVSDACREVGALNKVIIEACYLTDEEKVVACRLAQLARADFVKTSTGFGTGGATIFDVALMRETVGLKMGVKAAGGIHDADDARAMITAGANRIGASAGIRIVTGDEGGSGESY
ncbi:MAG: deoxyribose-phosphate aldolase [Candidatus Sulfomarinibacteraceae bacterium]